MRHNIMLSKKDHKKKKKSHQPTTYCKGPIFGCFAKKKKNSHMTL